MILLQSCSWISIGTTKDDYYTKHATSMLQAMVGRHDEFEASLRKLRGANANISQEKADIQVKTSFHFIKFYGHLFCYY